MMAKEPIWKFYPPDVWTSKYGSVEKDNRGHFYAFLNGSFRFKHNIEKKASPVFNNIGDAKTWLIAEYNKYDKPKTGSKKFVL